MRPDMRPGRAVVKIGGSLAADPARLRPILAEIAALAGEVVVVPGGGIFADAVRTAQAQLGFDDGLAHRLALDAMAAMAQVFAALEPRLATANGLPAIRAAWADTLVPVWDPAALRGGDPGIPESWDVTSDSLAVWLATALGAGSCLLVKSADAPPGSEPKDWAATGLVDAALPGFAGRYRGTIAVHGPASGSLAARLGTQARRRSPAAYPAQAVP